MQGVWIDEEHTCSTFDSGRCEPTNSFKNIQNLLVSVDKLDDNNFDELRIEYFRDLQGVEKERTEDKLEPKPACIAHNDYVSTLLPALVFTNRSTRRPIEPLSNMYVVHHGHHQ